MQFKALVFHTFNVRPDTLGVVSLAVTKGIPDRVRDDRDGVLGREVSELLHHVADLLLDAIPALQTVVETGEVTIWVLVFHPAHRWRDLIPLQLSDPVTGRLDPGVVGAAQVPVTICAPGARRVGGSVDRGAFARRPLPLVLAPHPAGFLGGLVPLLGLCLFFRRVLPGRGGLFRGNCLAQLNVVLLPAAGLGGDSAVTTVSAAPGTGVAFRRLVRLTWPVGSHWTSSG